jgi:hypothetical protein
MGAYSLSLPIGPAVLLRFPHPALKGAQPPSRGAKPVRNPTLVLLGVHAHSRGGSGVGRTPAPGRKLFANDSKYLAVYEALRTKVIGVDQGVSALGTG